MSRVTTWVATAVLLVAAGVVSNLAPAEDVEVTPFAVEGEIGETSTGRDIAATVTGVRGAQLLTATNGWQAEAAWLVVDLEAASVTGPAVTTLTGAQTLRLAEIVLDGRTYRASERMPSLLGERLHPGVPRSGSLAFELPELAGQAVLRLAVSSDTRADSVLEIPIDLDAVPSAPEAAMTETGWAR